MFQLKSQKSGFGSGSAKPTTQEPFSLSKSTAFAGLQTALDVFKEVAEKTGVPGLQEGVQSLVIVLAAIQVCRALFLYVPHTEHSLIRKRRRTQTTFGLSPSASKI